MPEKIEAEKSAEELKEEIVAQTEAAAAAPAVEEPVAENTAVTEEIQAAPEAESATAEETPVTEETPAEQPAVELSQMADMMKSFTESMAATITALTEAVKSLTPAPAPVTEEPKVAAEKALTNEQPADGVSDDHDALLKQIADLQTQVADLSKPAERKGALPIDEAVTETKGAEADQHVKKSAIGLHEAVKRYLSAGK